MVIEVLLGQICGRKVYLFNSQLIQLAIKFILNILICDGLAVIIQSKFLKYGQLLLKLSHIAHILSVITYVVVNNIKSSSIGIIVMMDPVSRLNAIPNCLAYLLKSFIIGSGRHIVRLDFNKFLLVRQLQVRHRLKDIVKGIFVFQSSLVSA